MTADTAKPAQAAGRVKLPPWLRSHTVPRDLRWPLPAGWEWCGREVRGELRNESRSFIVSGDLWPEEVRQRMEGAVVVSAVSGTVAPETQGAWTWLYLMDPRFNVLRPRVPCLLEFPRGHALRITMRQCRQGELFAWPVRRITQATP